MRDLLDNILDILRGAWRFRWRALLVAWIIAALGWSVVWMMRDTYEASARVFVDGESVLKPLLEGLAVGTDVGSDLRLISTVLLSRPNLTRVARETDLHLRTHTPEDFDQLIASLGVRIRLVSEGVNDTYTISYADYDRTTAFRVVQTLLNTFVEDTLGLKREDSTSAQLFLHQQIREYEGRLREAEDRLADFKRANVGRMPGEQGDYYTRLQAGLDGLQALRARQRQVSERRNELSRQLEGEEPTFGLVASGAAGPPTPYDAQITELRARLETLRVRFTDKHPEVAAVLDSIARLEAEKLAAGYSVGSPLATADPQKRAMAALDLNPVYQNMKIALSQADAELAELRGQIAAAEAQIGELQARVNTIPQVEAELARLNRDYEVNRAQHTQLLQRLEYARISEEADQSRDKVKFRVIDPPEVPLRPAGPDRPLLISLALLLALGSALGWAYVQSQLSPVYSTRDALERDLNVRALGSISTVRGPALVPWFRREPVLLSAGMVMLAFAYSANLVLAL